MQQNSAAERHKTSMFSQYQNNSNNSISSKQLQYWLLQMAPSSHLSPKFGNDWNLISTSSRYQNDDGITFAGRQNTFESFKSGNKQNISSHANLLLNDKLKQHQSLKQHNHSFNEKQGLQKMKTSKSYVSAMQDLQKRAKTLEEQNFNMRKSIQLLQQDKRSSLQQSMVQSQHLKSKMFQISQIQKRSQQIRKQNKKLRDCKNEQTQKLKLMQKSINQHKQKVKAFEQRLDLLSKQNETLKQQLNETKLITKSVLSQNKLLSVKAETLQNMKQKSTNSILEKYAKALKRIQQLQLTISQIKNKSGSMEENHKKSISQKQSKHFSLLECINSLKLQKQQLSMKIQMISIQNQDKNKKISQLQIQLTQSQTLLALSTKQAQSLQNQFFLQQKQLSSMNKNYKKLKKMYEAVLKNKIQNQMQNQVKTQNEQKFHNIEEDSPAIEIYQRQDQQESEQQINNQNNNVFSQIGENTFKVSKPLSIITTAKNTKPLIQSQNQSQNQQLNENQQHFQTQGQYQEEQSNSKAFLSSKNLKSSHNQQRKSKQISKTIEEKHKTNKTSTKMAKNKNQKKVKKQDASLSVQKNSSKAYSKQKEKSVKACEDQRSSLKKSKLISTSLLSNNQQKQIKKLSKQVDTRSKSSSLQKKKIQSKKSVSVDSKRKSSFVVHEQINLNNAERQNNLLKSCQPSQSRFINQRPSHHEYRYNSAGMNRYTPNFDPEHYYYTNQINEKKFDNSEQIAMNHKSFQQTSNFNNNFSSSMIKSQNDSKNTLNKALLLEYQQEALKLYEEHQNLIQVSENQNMSNQERAQILGRIRQVMTMIDHNTDKIFSIRGRMQ